MSSTQLTHPIFQSDQRTVLRLPDFNTVSLTYLHEAFMLIGCLLENGHEKHGGESSGICAHRQRPSTNIWAAEENAARGVFQRPDVGDDWLTVTKFRILSAPCSVIRDITVDTVEMLEKARDTSSFKTRVVLSMFLFS